MRHLLSLLLLSFFGASLAQQGVMDYGLIHDKYPVFKASEIQRAGIKTITIREREKPSGREIIDHGRRFIYTFDHTGTMTSHTRVFPTWGGMDTTRFSFVRKGDRLVCENEKMGGYERETRYRETDVGETERTVFVKRGAGDWQKIAAEIITEKGNELFVSGLGSTPYQREIFTEKDGTRTIETWTGNRLQNRVTWYVGADSLMCDAERDYKQSAMQVTLRGSEGHWCVNGKCKRWSIVLHENGFPKGWIFIDPATQDVEIWEFSYE